MHEIEAQKTGEGLEFFNPGLQAVTFSEKKKGDECDIYLRFHGAWAASDEMMKAQILLNPFEKELDFPSLFVERSNVVNGALKIIRDKP